MANITISELRPAGADLFSDSESYLTDLTGSETLGTLGGAGSITVCWQNDKTLIRSITICWGSSLLGMVRYGGINRLNPYLTRDLID
jgi:hypothetical protein